MKLSDALRLAGGPKPDVYLDRILVTRMREDSTFIQLRVGLCRFDRRGSGTTWRSRTRTRSASSPGPRSGPRSTWRIVGAVRRPGRVRLSRGDDVRDADPAGRRAHRGRPARDRDRPAAREPAGGRAGRDGARAARLELRAGAPAAAGAAPRPRMRRSSPTTTCSCSGRAAGRCSARWSSAGRSSRPGRYSLRSKTERLADLIERAGGLTAEAYPGGIQFYRVLRGITSDRAPIGCPSRSAARRPDARLDCPRASRARRHRPAAGAQGSQVSATT